MEAPKERLWRYQTRYAKHSITQINNFSPQAWLNASYPIPDSMQEGWGSNGNPPDGESDNKSSNENVTEGSSTGKTDRD